MNTPTPPIHKKKNSASRNDQNSHLKIASMRNEMIKHITATYAMHIAVQNIKIPIKNKSTIYGFDIL